MEAKSQQNFYNKAYIVKFLQNFLFGAYTLRTWCKGTKWLIIIHYFRFMLCIAFTLSNINFSSLNSLGYMRSRHEILSHSCSRVLQKFTGFDTAGSRFQKLQPSLSHTYSIGFKSCNKLGRGRLAMFC